MSSEKNFVLSLREVVQDLLVPELKAVKVSIDSMREEMKLRNESLEREMKLHNENLEREMKLRHDNLERMIKYGDDRNEQLIRTLSDKLDFALEVRERLANIESRMPKQ